MSHPPTLESRISRLPDGVDGQLRAEIGQQMQTLRGVRDAKAVLVSLSRLSLRLLRLIYERAGHKPPSDNLYDCLVTAGRGDPDRKVRGLNLVPDEIVTGLHTVRTLSNKVDHALEGVQLSVTDAETALSLHLRALEWFYYEAAFGPRLTQGRPTAPRSWRRWALAAAAVVLAGILLSLAIGWPFGQTSSSPRTVPAAVPLPEWARQLKAAPVLELLARSAPPRPPGDFVPPRFHFDLLGRRKSDREFRQLANGAELASGVDDYLVVVRPKSPGYLYVFQLDAGGKLSWLFPENPTCSFSSGVNPLVVGGRTCIPAEERKTALYLDDQVGLEHVFAVFSVMRWTELENALEQAGRETVTATLPLEQLDLTRGVGGTRPIEADQSVELQLMDEKAILVLAAREQASGGSFLVVSRWFRHVGGKER